MNSSPARGRRRGNPDTRAHILAIAREHFAREGYQRATLRAIAADAGVDLALISYYFGSKRGLVAAVLELVVSPADLLQSLLEGDLDTFGPRALRAMISAWDDPVSGRPLRAVLAGAGANPDVVAVVRSAVQAELIDTLAARLGGSDARVRAGLFASQFAGIIFTRYLMVLEPVASMTVDELAARLGPALTHILRAPVRPPRPPRRSS